jgi:heme exporter protein D
MSEWNYIWAAYGLTWLVFAGYGIYLTGKIRQARRRLDGVARHSEVGR